jgi:hypothetical protein
VLVRERVLRSRGGESSLLKLLEFWTFGRLRERLSSEVVLELAMLSAAMRAVRSERHGGLDVV